MFVVLEWDPRSKFKSKFKSKSKSVKKETCSTCTMFVSVLVMVSGVLLVMCCFMN